MASSSASAQALGYYYQVRYALHHILDAPNEGSAYSIQLEKLADLEAWDKARLREVIELKHHTNAESTLTDRSVDLWRTIRIWSNHLQSKKISVPQTQLILVTTAQAPDGSIASMLMPDKNRRNTAMCLEKLCEIAENPSKTIKKFTQPFKNLSIIDKKLLVDSIYVFDDAPHIDELADDIKNRICFASRSLDHTHDLYNDLEGWWFGKIVDHLLNESSDAITFQEVHHKLGEIAKRYDPYTITTSYAFDEPDADTKRQYDKKQFVSQLKFTKIRKFQIREAILDYYRCYKERNDWVKKLQFNSDLNNYELAVEKEWRHEYNKLLDKLLDEYDLDVDDLDENDIPPSGVVDEKYLQKFGKDLYNKVMEKDVPIGNNIMDAYITRGTFHRLADKSPDLTVRWHPRFGLTKEGEQDNE